MKLISKKNRGEGYKKLIKIHKNHGSYKDDVCSNDESGVSAKPTVLNDLLEEQGYICAYCMRKIDENSATLEHIIGQNYRDEKGNEIGKEEDTNYLNMLAVCKGNSCINSLHCDKSRAKFQDKRALLFISPLNESQMKNIKFSQSGVIYYKEPDNLIDIQKESLKDKEIRYDINSVLNLNCDNLVEQRGRLSKTIRSILIRCKFNKKIIKQKLDNLMNINGKNEEFCQVAIYELNKYI